MASKTGTQDVIGGINAARIASFKQAEDKAYALKRPAAKAALGSVKPAFLSGVPMHWMLDWPMPYPMLVDKAKARRSATLTATNWMISSSETRAPCSATRLPLLPGPSAAKPSAA